MNRRSLTLVTLLLWGLILTKVWASGLIAAYLHPQFHPLVAISGLSLLVLAFLWWWATGPDFVHDHGHDHGCGCHHGHEDEGRSRLSAGAVFGFAVLLLPVCTALFVSPNQFGEAAVKNRGIVTSISQLPSAAFNASSPDDAPALAAGEDLPDVADWPQDQEEGVEYFTRGADGSIELETIDLLFAAEEPALREQFEGQRVAVTGQYVPSGSGNADRFDLVRMLMVCCAADAKPVGVSVVSAQPSKAPRMGWIRVTGTARFREDSGSTQPLLEAAKIEEVPAPRETVLY